MSNGIIRAICISPTAGGDMRTVNETAALKGFGLSGDRYSTAAGSFNQKRPGQRQVTLINAQFVADSEYSAEQTRRNIVVEGAELMCLLGHEFQIGNARMRGVAYCDPCKRPAKLAGKDPESFMRQFHDRGGIVAEVIEEGTVAVGDLLIPSK
jgi:hypothetical protein